jgi:hypothetical protein
VLDVGGGSGSHLSLLKSIEPRIRRTMVVDFDASGKVIAEQGLMDARRPVWLGRERLDTESFR